MRHFLPSYTDILFVFIIVFSFIAGEMGWQRLLQDSDTGLHIRIGDYILEHRQVPTHDMFSFSLPGRAVTVDFLGEDTTDRAQADAALAEYVALVTRLGDLAHAPTVEVSVKLSALG